MTDSDPIPTRRAYPESSADQPVRPASASDVRARLHRWAVALVVSFVLALLTAFAVVSEPQPLAESTRSADVHAERYETSRTAPTSSHDMPFGSIVELVHRLAR